MLDARFTRRLGTALLLLTVTALLLPWDPLGPFDARDYSRLPGVQLHYPLLGALFEPLFAPAHIILGAPDYRLASVSVLLWGVLAAGVAAALRSRRRGQGWVAGAARGLVASGVAGLLIFGYVLANAIWHPPGWRLSAADPDLMVVDLQSHTRGSHDGLVAPEVNLAWHAARGYDVVAVTEHIDPAGAFAAAASVGPNGPVVIPGVEVNSEQEEFLLGLGLSPELPVLGYVQQRQEYARHFVADVHEAHGGAVVAMAWRIEADQIRRLVAVGVDAFEIANTAHPEIPADVRAAMLEAHRQGRVLVASTDWHGWGGVSRTWTLVRVPGWRSLTPSQRQAAVVERLKKRDAAAFIPVTAGRLEPPSLARLVFSPLVESVRYAAELSPLRVASWWLWGLALLGLTRWSRRGSRSVNRMAGGVATLGLGLALVTGALRLLALPESAAGAEFAAETGLRVLWVGAGVLAVALGIMVRGGHRQRMAVSCR